MNKKWVVNASPLIVLGKISLLEVLTSLCSEIVIPAGVATEINNGKDDDPAKIWLKEKGKKFIKNIKSFSASVNSWDLGLGETEVLSYAVENKEYTAIVDDRAARNCAISLNIKYKGTLGIIAIAKEKGLITSAEDVISKLLATGFRIDNTIIDYILKAQK